MRHQRQAAAAVLTQLDPHYGGDHSQLTVSSRYNIHTERLYGNPAQLVLR